MTLLMTWICAGWIVTILIGVPLLTSMLIASFAFVVLGGLPPEIIPQKVARSVDSFPIVAAPLFILMGNIMNSAGITDRIFVFAKAVVGWLRGGLCHANIIASVIFAGMAGSSVAEAGALGTIEIKAMKDDGYDPELAASVSAASATIGPIIPPSLPMVIYGVTADVSIGRLFLAGLLPGLLMAAALMAMVVYIARKLDLPRTPFPTMPQVWVAFRDSFWALMTPVVLLAGMFSGYFTPTEAAAVATCYALFLGMFVYRGFDLRSLPDLLRQTAETTGVVMGLVMAAGAFGWCMSLSGIPQKLGPLLVEVLGNPILFLLAVNISLLAIGCFIEALAAMLILVPILAPAAAALGIDPVQFGVVFVLNLMIGTITPPVGVVLFITARIANVSFEAMSRAILPWLVPLILVLLLVTFWPPLTLTLPGLLMP